VPHYDRILTNPPFYTSHLRSPDQAVNRALHTDELPFDELVTAVVRLLKPDGQWWVLLPPQQMDELVARAQERGLQPFRQLMIRHHAQKPVFRIITGFTFVETNGSLDLLTIYEPDNRMHTAEFRALLRDFYLLF
jgi:tRNA1Val (adenine37-N6)-methyltransferase